MSMLIQNYEKHEKLSVQSRSSEIIEFYDDSDIVVSDKAELI